MAKAKEQLDSGEGIQTHSHPEWGQILDAVEQLRRENEQLRSQLEFVQSKQDAQPMQRSAAIAKRAKAILEKNKKMRVRVDKDGNPTKQRDLTAYEPHVLVDRPTPNWAVWTRMQSRYDQKRFQSPFRKKPILFYSDQTDEKFVIAEYEREFGTKFNEKLQELRRHKG